MISNPPSNSLVLVKQSAAGTHILIPAVKKGIGDYAVAAFLGFWLCGWALGEYSAIKSLLTHDKGPNLFLLAWLGGWTVGGFFAGSAFLAALLPNKNEEIIIAHEGLIRKNP